MKKIVIAAVCACALVGTTEVRTQQPPPPRSPTSTNCKAAKNLSTVRAWNTDRVNVSENIPQQECRFTINGSPGAGGGGAMAAAGRSGAPAGAPSTPGVGQPGAANVSYGAAIQQAWSSILRQNWSDTNAFPVSDLALVLESTGADQGAAALRQVLDQNSAQLRTCFAARAQGVSFTFSSGALVCVSTREPFQGVVTVVGSPGVEFVTGAPHLRFAVLAGPLAHYMFLPAGAPQ